MTQIMKIFLFKELKTIKFSTKKQEEFSLSTEYLQKKITIKKYLNKQSITIKNFFQMVTITQYLCMDKHVQEKHIQ